MPLPQMHGRTHCPGGSDPIPCLPGYWARRSKGFDAANQTIGGTGSVTTITWNHDYNMTGSESGVGYFEANSNAIKVLNQGIYIVTAEIMWFEAANFNYVLSISDGLAGAGHYQQGANLGATTISSSISFTHRWTANTNISLTVAQDSGVNKNIDAAYLEIVLLAGYTGTDFVDMNPDQ